MFDNFAIFRIIFSSDAVDAPTNHPNSLRNSMKWLVQDAKPGDSLLFFFAGHGGQTRDLDGDEEDGQDEHLCPVIQGQNPKFQQALHGSLEQEEAEDLLGKAVSDDEIYEIMLKLGEKLCFQSRCFLLMNI